MTMVSAIRKDNLPGIMVSFERKQFLLSICLCKLVVYWKKKAKVSKKKPREEYFVWLSQWTDLCRLNDLITDKVSDY